MTDTELVAKVAKILGYTPIIYTQSLYSTNQNAYGKEYVIEFKHTEIPDDSILLLLPLYSSIDTEESEQMKLLIRVPKIMDDGTYSYSDVSYDIIVEQNDNLPRKAGKNDIIAGRLCLFRFKHRKHQAILCNSPLYNDASFNNLKVNNATFYNLPTYVDPATPNITYTLVTTKEFVELKNEVDKLKNRIRFGTEDPEEALRDAPAGTLYIQHESD